MSSSSVGWKRNPAGRLGITLLLLLMPPPPPLGMAIDACAAAVPVGLLARRASYTYLPLSSGTARQRELGSKDSLKDLERH
jgi:hypothetical protein